MFNFGNLKNKEEDVVDMQTPEKDVATKTEEEEYIWVDGYKGTDADMSCTVVCRKQGDICLSFKEYRQQYELKKVINFEGEPETCGSGFHFCLSLPDVFYFRPLTISGRYFKVRGLVRKKEYEELLQNKNRTSKLAAKSIVLTEEIVLDYDFLKKNSLNYLSYDDEKIYLSKEEFEDCFVKKLYPSDKSFFIKTFRKVMKKANYSDVFTELMIKEKNLFQLLKMIPAVEALDAEGVSKDMAVYTLLTWGKR